MKLGFADARRVVPFVFFAVLLFVGIGVFRDYGVSWDERVQREYGEKVYNYVTAGDRELFTDRHRYYGPVIEFALFSLEKALGLDDTRQVYLMRHLVVFLTFWLGAVFFYLLSKRELKSWKLGLLGSGLLILSPRIFAHAFYNSKDIPFMCMFIIGIFTLVRYLDVRSFIRAAAHGVICALLIDIRIVGVFLPVLTAGFVLREALKSKGTRSELRRIGLTFSLYIVILISLTVLLWPTLWRDPLGNFIRVFEGMRNFPWEATVTYLGSDVWSTQLPWHYIPVWIAVSTPLAVTVLFIVGLAVSIRTRSRIAVLAIAWFFLPLVYSILSGAVLYDAWRHTFFIYPAMLLLAAVGAGWLWGVIGARFRGTVRRVLAWGLVILIALNLGSAAVFMVRNHPHQNVYFSALTGGIRGAEGRFDLDYWGLSYRQALEHVLANDPQDRIMVYAPNPPGWYNADILRPEERKRLVFSGKPNRAQYYLTNFRWERSSPPGEEVFSIKVDGVRIMAVHRLHRISS
ncbi:MAG: hypothetical protein ABIJ00_01330 [Candidatus Eisenbacteria bacterium]